MPRFDRPTLIATLCAAALFACTAFLGAQAPVAQPRAQPPAGQQGTPPAGGRGGLPGTESGWATFQGGCAGCHGIIGQIGTAPTAWAIRQMPPKRIYAALQGQVHHERTLTSIQAQRVAEFMAGRPLDSVDAGDAKSMANQCTANPAMSDPAKGPAWNGWGNDLSNTRAQTAAAARLTAADVPRLKVKWAFGIPHGMTSNAQPTAPYAACEKIGVRAKVSA